MFGINSLKEVDWFYVLCVIGFAAYGIYYLYNSRKLIIGNVKARNDFMNEHTKENITRYDNYLVWVILEFAALAYCIYSVFTISDRIEQSEWYRLAFAMIGVIMIGQMALNIVKGRLLVGEKGFVYENDYVPFQSIVSMDPKRNLVFTLVDVLCLRNKKYSMPGKCGQFLHEAYLEYKKERKAGKKK